jgi:hypothetical protein
MLCFYDDLFNLESSPFKKAHNLIAQWHDRASLPGVSDKKSTVLAFFQYTITFGSYKNHLFQEVVKFILGQIRLDSIAIPDYICIRRMSTNKIDTVIFDITQVPRITLAYFDTTGVLAIKVAFFAAGNQRGLIDVDAYDVSVEQFSLDKCRAASGKLIQNPVPCIRVAQYYIPWDVRRPVATVFGVMSGPIAAFREIPNGVCFQGKIVRPPFFNFHGCDHSFKFD